MKETNRIYEEPSRLSQGLIVGLSLAIVAMAGWFVITIAESRTRATVIEGDTDVATTTPPPPATSGNGAQVSDGVDASPQQTPSVHFDWPKFTTVPDTPPPPAAVLSLAPEPPPAHDVGRPGWPAPAPVPDARNAPSRQAQRKP